MTTFCYQVSNSLYLVRHEVSKKAPAKSVEVPIHHILVYDCSGSMAYDLPKIREQMKRKLPKMLKTGDTLSIVWFSGRGQFGTLIEGEPVATLADLQQVTRAIDRWLVQVGMTGFKEPLVEAAALAKRLIANNPKAACSLLFFTDGCDNQWGLADVLRAVEQAAEHVQSATFVEYGYYANRPLLAQMAEKSGGSLIFAEDFLRYEPQFEAAIQRKLTGAKRVEVKIGGEAVGGFAYALVEGDLVTFSVDAGSVLVPEDLTQVFYLSTACVGANKGNVSVSAKASVAATPKGGALTHDGIMISATYAAISLFAVRMKPDIVFPLLKATGDVALIEEFANCFGKQKYSAFMETAKRAAFDAGIRLAKGFDPNRVPREDAFTVLDLLNLLQEDDSARVLIDLMKYSRIGRRRIDATDQLTDDEQAKVTALTEEMSKTKDAKKIRDLSAQISALTDKPEALKFVQKVPSNGLPIDGLTFNEDRPNVSFRVKVPGVIDLKARLSSLSGGPTLASVIPEQFQCFQFRNFTIVKDGLINIEKLPAVVSQATYDKLLAEGVIDGPCTFTGSGPAVEGVLIDLTRIPVINRRMIKELSARTFFQTAYDLTKAKAAQKVYRDYANLLPKRVSQGYADKYGDEAATWLKDQGITDYNGFQPPHTMQAPSTDVYTGKELKVSLKGLSSLPKVSEIKAKVMRTGSDGAVEWLPNPKLNAPGALMAEAVKEVESFLANPIYTRAADQPAVLQAWLDGQTRAAIKRARTLIFEVSRATFCTVVGQVWFQEFKSLDENELTIRVDGQDIACKVEMKEVQIPI